MAFFKFIFNFFDEIFYRIETNKVNNTYTCIHFFDSNLYFINCAMLFNEANKVHEKELIVKNIIFVDRRWFLNDANDSWTTAQLPGQSKRTPSSTISFYMYWL
jgi:hypothetical protein